MKPLRFGKCHPYKLYQVWKGLAMANFNSPLLNVEGSFPIPVKGLISLSVNVKCLYEDFYFIILLSL